MANLGSDDTPITGESFGLPSGWSLTENGDGEIVIEDSGGNVVFRRDETAGEWVTDSIDAESVSVDVLDGGVTTNPIHNLEGDNLSVTNNTLNAEGGPDDALQRINTYDTQATFDDGNTRDAMCLIPIEDLQNTRHPKLVLPDWGPWLNDELVVQFYDFQDKDNILRLGGMESIVRKITPGAQSINIFDSDPDKIPIAGNSDGIADPGIYHGVVEGRDVLEDDGGWSCRIIYESDDESQKTIVTGGVRVQSLPNDATHFGIGVFSPNAGAEEVEGTTTLYGSSK